MKNIFLALTIFTFLFISSNSAFGVGGELDPTFGTNGIVMTDFNNLDENGNEVALQADGKIVVVGTTTIGGTINRAFAVARYNTDGTLDTTFGANGFYTKDITPVFSDYLFGVAIQPDGKIILAGNSDTYKNRIVIRLNSDGTPDNSFATDGVFTLSLLSSGITTGTSLDNPSVVLQSDGKIVVAGTNRFSTSPNVDQVHVLRLNTDGTLDTSFGNGNGFVTTSISNGNANGGIRAFSVRLQTDGKIVAGGYAGINNNGVTGNTPSAVRYNTDGTLDSTFGTGGIAIFPLDPARQLSTFGETIQPDGKILLAGRGSNVNGIAIVRFNTDGTPDSTFGTNGIAFNTFNPSEGANKVHFRNNKIVVTGYTTGTSPRGYLVAQYNADGSVDTSFGTNGAVQINFGNSATSIGSVFQPDGKLILSGTVLNLNQPTRQDFALARLTGVAAAAVLDKTFADFDGDGRADLSVFRGTTGEWIIQQSTNGFKGLQFGISTDKPTPADFDGDGKTDVAVWRENSNIPGRSFFYILNSGNNTFRTEQFGAPGDDPSIVGDFDGDGKADPAVYRSGSTSAFYYRPSSQSGVDFTTILWGSNGDKPMRGDFDGDGKLDAAVFRPANNTWYILQSSENQPRYDYWGTAADKFVNADYDGDGKTDLAVFRNGTWYIKQSSNNQPRYEVFGLASDKLVPADYDGDGKTDIAVYRNGTWYILQSSNASLNAQLFGTGTDTPIPSAFVVQ